MNVGFRTCLLVGVAFLSACNLFSETVVVSDSDDASTADMSVPDAAGAPDTSMGAVDMGRDTAPPEDMNSMIEKDASMVDLGPDQPVCVPETDAEICARLGATCDSISASDNCGASRTTNCGTCPASEQCQANQCRCVAESDAEFCARNGSECAPTSAMDNCQTPRTVDCGTCTAPDTCQQNQCECIPETDAELCDRLTIDCGSRTDTDNCGAARTVDCGGCTAPAVCGGGGTVNVCACTTQSDADFCAANGATCGPLTAQDDCGLTRTVACGACNAPETCGGGGVANECGCTPDSDAALCAALGAACGSTDTTDNCGGMRTLDCGTCSGGTCVPTTNQCGVRVESFPDAMLKSNGQQPTDTVTVSTCTSIVSVTVDIDITHPYRGDLRVELTSPQGTVLLLKAEGSGGSADDLLGNYPLTLTPVDSLDALVGEDGTGDWTMAVSDLFNQDNGTWNSWAINLSCN